MVPSLTETAGHDRVVLTLAGDFDLQTRDELMVACQRARRLGPERHVCVDLSRVGYIDCGSLRVIAALVRARRALGDPATLVVTSPFLRRLVEMLGFADPHVVVARLDDVA
jgi:anti-anti-sigma factor